MWADPQPCIQFECSWQSTFSGMFRLSYHSLLIARVAETKKSRSGGGGRRRKEISVLLKDRPPRRHRQKAKSRSDERLSH